MFFPLHLLPPKDSLAFNQQALAWCQAGERYVYLAGEAATAARPVELSLRTLSSTDLAAVEIHLSHAQTQVEFGGVVSEYSVDAIHSLCFFKIDEFGEAAQLTAFVSSDKLLLDSSPLQSPLLLLPLAALLRHKPNLERFYLPFHEIWQEDVIRLALYYFAPSHKSGWWQQANTQAELADLLAFPVDGPVEKWWEISMQVEPEVEDYISRLFARYGYQQRLLIQELRPQDDEAATRLVLYTYLPFGAVADNRIMDLTSSLASLATLRPLNKLQVTERDTTYWQTLWQDAKVFRVGEQIVLTADRKNYVPTEDEILVEIPVSPTVFSLSSSGPHPTTAFCLQMLDQYLDRVQPANRMLDLGTGSGTVAIVAAHLGVSHILALDAFLPAVALAQANVVRNNVGDRVQVEAGSLAIHIKKDTLVYSFTEEDQQPPATLEAWLPFDLIVCNTFAHVLEGLANALFRALCPGGLLISGGILNYSAGGVAESFKKAGFELLEQLADADWTCFVHARPLVL